MRLGLGRCCCFQLISVGVGVLQGVWIHTQMRITDFFDSAASVYGGLELGASGLFGVWGPSREPGSVEDGRIGSEGAVGTKCA